MREIKFRAWNGERMKEVLTWGFNEKFISTPKEVSPEDDFKVMQYTGLKDKNGKEIYEGDLVYLAGYGNYQAVFPFIELYEAEAEKDIGEIIGNIYENPELLSKDK